MTAKGHELPSSVVRRVRDAVRSKAMAHFVESTLQELVSIETVPGADLAQTREHEREVLECIERASASPGAWFTVQHAHILPDIDRLKDYTVPYYARRPDGALPPAARVYADRCNLLLTLAGAGKPGERGSGLAMNAHVDVVAPHFPFSKHDGRLWGRGTVDDKGQCVAMLAAVRVLEELRASAGVRPSRDVTLQFVIDEEPGGNGSLSLAADPRQDYGCVCVCEATGLRVHPANRGATWYRVEVERLPQAGPSATVAAAQILLELRAEGERIKAESEHSMFPTRPVQTCNGILGVWGQHPSRVCPLVVLCIRRADEVGQVSTQTIARVDAALRQGVQAHCRRYGDATAQPDPDDPTSPKIVRHYDILPRQGHVQVALYGKSGHMGGIDQLDCAATKAAYVLMELEKALGADAEIALCKAPSRGQQAAPSAADSTVLACGPHRESLRRVVLEGGQGFVPTHSIDQVQRRLGEAAQRAARRFCEAHALAPEAIRITTSFEKLHNNAFERPVDSPGVRAALDAVRLAGVYSGEPVLGWDVSCDARLFADLWPQTDVFTFGPGELRYAHSDGESITVEELLKGAEALTYMALLYGRQE